MFNLDASDALQKLTNTLQALQSFEDSHTERLAHVARDSANSVQQRIQTRGENSDGERMQTDGTRRTGAYSEQYGKERQRAGLQTGIIDLTYSGRLFDAWGVQADGDEVGVGFNDYALHQRADYLEDYFGPIFSPSYNEQDDATTLMQLLATEALNSLLDA